MVKKKLKSKSQRLSRAGCGISSWIIHYPINDQCSHHIETSQLICRTNQLAGFYMMGTLVIKGLWSKLWLVSSRMKTRWKDFEYPLTIFVEGSIEKHPPDVFYKKVFQKNFAKFTKKHLCQRCFPVNFNLELLCTEKSDERKPLIQLLSF